MFAGARCLSWAPFRRPVTAMKGSTPTGSGARDAPTTPVGRSGRAQLAQDAANSPVGCSGRAQLAQDARPTGLSAAQAPVIDGRACQIGQIATPEPDLLPECLSRR